ncbi:MAG: hypothetical protein JW787_03530 [Sedimentisphaerales bacterium]|nr:hypothetical protein [Sedimentisphaerales bacterium]
MSKQKRILEDKAAFKNVIASIVHDLQDICERNLAFWNNGWHPHPDFFQDGDGELMPSHLQAALEAATRLNFLGGLKGRSNL